MKLNTLLSNLSSGQFLGIDPGNSGAIAYLYLQRDGSFCVGWIPVKETEGYKSVFSTYHFTAGGPVSQKPTIFVERERVSGLMSPTAAGTFMAGYGFCLGVCHCLGVEPILFDPQAWMKTLGLIPYRSCGDFRKDKALRKKHYEAQIRSLWGSEMAEVPSYAADAYGILLAGLISLNKTKQ